MVFNNSLPLSSELTAVNSKKFILCAYSACFLVINPIKRLSQADQEFKRNKQQFKNKLTLKTPRKHANKTTLKHRERQM